MKEGYFELAVASLLYASFGIWVNVLSFTGAQSSFIAAAGVTVLALVWIHFTDGLKSLLIKTKKHLVVGIVLASILAAWLIFEAMTLIPIGEAILLHYTAPLWVMLYHLITKEEKITNWSVASLLLGMMGVVLILGIENFFSLSNFQWGHILGVASGMGLGSIFLIRRKLKDSHATKPLLFWANFGMLVFFAPIVLPMATPEPLWALAGFVIAVFGARFLFYEGVRKVPAYLASIIMLLEPVGAAVLGWLLLSQALSFESIIGAVLLLAGLYLVYTKE